MKRLLVFGAAGSTGQQVVAQAARGGHDVRAVERSWPEDMGWERNVGIATADVLEDDLRPLMAGVDAVVSCLGVGNDAKTLLDPPPLYTTGTRRILQAMQAEGVARIVVISATFVETGRRGPLWFRLPAMAALHRVIEEMQAMEAQLRRAQGIDWTAVRPGWLMQGEATADYVVTPDVIPEDMIRTRHADLAEFMLKCALNGDWIGQTPAIARPEPASASSPGKVAEMILG